jgi:hypothetical protein
MQNCIDLVAAGDVKTLGKGIERIAASLWVPLEVAEVAVSENRKTEH